MTEEFKNLAWRCLPKDAREEMRRTYKYQCRNIEYNRGFNEALEEIFGHNLTSDTEPSELLFVERKKLVNICKDAPINIEQSVLYELFGDKCLPDKTEPKPKFNKGAKIKLNCRDSKGDVLDAIMDGRIATISDIYTNAQGVIMYKFEEGIRDFGEHCLEPYTETEAKRKETQNLSHLEEQSTETKDAYEQYQDAMAKESRKCDESEDDILYEKDGISLENESKIDEMMEEKELNLLELLKGCEDETFYSPALGTVWIHSINDEEIEIVGTSEDYAITVDGTGKWNLFFKTHVCILFPSKELYEKYPLDAAKAWDEWAEERKPKRWRAKKGEVYYSFGCTLDVDGEVELFTACDDKSHEIGNYFRTDGEAKQAAEAVRKCLEEFHAKNTEP